MSSGYVRRPQNTARVKRRDLEHPEQVALFQWVALKKCSITLLELLYAIPNAGKRPGAAGPRMVAEGLKSGVWDMFLPVARNGKHGLYIEMKIGKNKLTFSQEDFGLAVACQGYATAVCYSWHEAAREILDYLGYEEVEI